MKILNYITGVIAGSLAVAGWAVLNVMIAPALGLWMTVFNVAYILAAIIFVSQYFNLSIPGIRVLLRRAYYRAKFSSGGKSGMAKAGPLKRLYIQFLVYLIWLFKETEEGFETIKDEAEHLYSSALLMAGGVSGKKPAKKELLRIHKRHQTRATALSLTALFILVIGTVVTGLVSSYIFPAVFQTQAATYTWEQVDWSGGTSTSTAMHPDDATGWTHYHPTTSDNILIDGDGNITLDSTSQEIVDSTTEEFQASDVPVWAHDDEVFMGYDGGEHCMDDFIVLPSDWPETDGQEDAKDICSDLCSDCRLPDTGDLECICNHEHDFGDNFVDGDYWSSADVYQQEDDGKSVYIGDTAYDSSDCEAEESYKGATKHIRCIIK